MSLKKRREVTGPSWKLSLDNRDEFEFGVRSILSVSHPSVPAIQLHAAAPSKKNLSGE